MIFEYIWLDGKNNLRMKIKRDDIITDWNYDGSSTFQRSVKNSEVILKPNRQYKSPFFENGEIVLCNIDIENVDKIKDLEIQLGFEQEYYICVIRDNTNDINQKGEYCSVGKGFGREISDSHLKACIIAGINIVGTNQEVGFGQWEYQIFGEGVKAIYDLIVSRYILQKTAEMYGYYISFDPKPFISQPSSGLHTNISSKKTREDISYINEIIYKISKKEPDSFLEFYGEGNEKRLTGIEETSHYNNFTFGIGDRTASIRIPQKVFEEGKGYFEDRRPSANALPQSIIKYLLQFF